ncbi:MAG: peptidylprolyl isomerase [Flavobacteriaceae bacterium]|nr:peptidylprolyl isomerase [Flavobacteriaceae bacterium]
MLFDLLRKFVKNVNSIVNNNYIRLNWLINFILFSVVFFSCNDRQDEVIARVEDKYLYKSDIKLKFNSFDNKKDSILKVRNFIDKWARKNLLYQKALINLPEYRIDNLENLINNYRYDLYGSVYKEKLLKKALDTLSLEKKINLFYEENYDIFKLNESLYKIRFIQFPIDNVDKNEIIKSFIRYNKIDKKFLDSLSYQFNNKIFSDSNWITKKKLINSVPFINNNNLKKYVKKMNYFEYKDSLELYLLYMLDYKKNGEIAPLSHVISSVKNIILNKNKIEFSKIIDRDIIQDAIKSKKFEIYK